jgi:hypothetical protein
MSLFPEAGIPTAISAAGTTPQPQRKTCWSLIGKIPPWSTSPSPLGRGDSMCDAFSERPVLTGFFCGMVRGFLFCLFVDILTWQEFSLFDRRILFVFIIFLILTSIVFYFPAKFTGDTIGKFYISSALFNLFFCFFSFFSGFSLLPARELNAADGFALLIYVPSYFVAAGSICLCLFLLLKKWKHCGIA